MKAMHWNSLSRLIQERDVNTNVIEVFVIVQIMANLRTWSRVEVHKYLIIIIIITIS